ncbi:LysR family transcriptional regulator [Halomonas organivorans]|uniref:DNA-binding transcriptional LysR family regulator n=1 Tax=Halomonas organivorans TaxID=257772 RepID=A0A7W5BUC5_9GAMM|nr:LysR family transcriptional regulator [Halomonas organivorans]MBB3139312.1 DNA-binding transcriptional LysR family regulator [Halomonas organivorans]
MHDSGKGVSRNEKPASRRVDWNDAGAFIAVARLGTLSGAAARLGVGIATLARRIERLEAAMGVPLFVRQQSGYRLTAEGKGLVPRAEALEAAAHAFASGVDDGQEMTGRIRLATAENLATRLILPALPRFRERYPGLAIDLVTDIPTANLQRRDADLAIRMVKPERGNLSFRRLGTLGYGLYASPGYLARRQSDRAMGDDGRDAFIAWGERQAHLPAARWVVAALDGREAALTTTSLHAQVVAAEAGLGLAVLPHLVARGTDLTCLEADIGVEQDIYLVIQTDLSRAPRVRALADFLGELVIERRDWLEAPRP